VSEEISRKTSPDVLVVPGPLAGERVDRAVAMLTGWSRSDVQQLVAAGAVRVDGRSVAKSHRLVAGATIELAGEPESPEPPGPEPVDFDVRYEDGDVLVVVKPTGIVVHPGAGREHGTLAHGLLHRYPEIARIGDPRRPGIVHRLDRETSGLLVVARSPVAYERLVAALAARRVDRRYLALVWGTPEPPRAIVDAPIGRSDARRTRMAVRVAGKEARTAYEVLEELGPAALLACTLETGRTHQIRVHLAAIGHPVVGDAPYGGARPGITAPRVMLHAGRLAFDHPATAEPLAFEEPPPEDFAGALHGLR
jgi:23S rRNA pseudouridine1911/1915/1917 synthase